MLHFLEISSLTLIHITVGSRIKDFLIPVPLLFFRWKIHKWRRCQLIPWSVRQDSPGAQETCGPGLQVRGEDRHTTDYTHIHTRCVLLRHLLKTRKPKNYKVWVYKPNRTGPVA